MHPRLRVRHERWPLARPFTIARGSKTAADVVVVEVEAAGHLGRGEAVPYAHYGETIDSVVAGIEATATAVAAGLDRWSLQTTL
ncbi:MAG: dipeptide epimerase, partial [Rhodospirillales bacterium]|nr:dipeptide epimerase [Rhodospirillales bacterium]